MQCLNNDVGYLDQQPCNRPVDGVFKSQTTSKTKDYRGIGYDDRVLFPLTSVGWTCFTAWHSSRERRVAFLPAEVLEVEQGARFRAMIRHAWDNVPYYRKWLQTAGAEPGGLRSANELSRLPLIDKLAMIRDPGAFSPLHAEKEDGLTLHSSGTSGIRRSFRHDAESLFHTLAAGRRQRLALAPFVGRETGYREAAVKNIGAGDDQLRRFWEARMFTPRGLDLNRRKIPPTLQFEEILSALNEFRPDVIRGIGSHIGAFLRWVHETGQRLHHPKAITYGADAMPPADRRLIEEEMSIPVVSSYQATEALRIGFQCEVRRGFHISTDLVAFRVVDSSGNDVQPGQQGEFVVSNLTNRATVVLNYRLGDVVTLSSGPCPCGRTLPLIEGIDGRLDDLLIRADGASVHALSVLPRLHAVAGVHQVQLIQTAVDEFRLRVVWARGCPAEAEGLRTRMVSVFGPRIRVTIEQVDDLESEPGGKLRTAICQVARS
jgi:phenylacetate-CoA ligase